MSVNLRKKDRIYSQNSTRDIIISMYFFKNLEFRWVRVLRGQNPPTYNLKLSIKIFDLTQILNFLINYCKNNK